MSSRMHLWLRIVGVALILLSEFGPRAWTSHFATGQSSARLASVANR